MKTTTLALAGGQLVLGPLLAATIRDHKEAIGAARRGELDIDAYLELTCALAAACARRVDAAVTLDQVEQLVDTENAPRVFAACWGVSLPEPQPGEAQAAGSPSS